MTTLAEQIAEHTRAIEALKASAFGPLEAEVAAAKEDVAAKQKAASDSLAVFHAKSKELREAKVAAGLAKPVAEKAHGEGRTRRPSSDVAELEKRISELVAKAPDGLSVGAIATSLGVDASDCARPLARAVQGGHVKAEGEKRHRRYFPVQSDPVAAE